MNKKLLPRSASLCAFALLLTCGGTALAAPAALDPAARLQLVRTAADHAGLKEVGLDFRDVYGVIHAETSWVPRTGMGKNGVASVGLGQFEPATAKAVGLRDPNDAAQAVNAAARLLREAAVWSGQRIARLGLAPEQRAAKLREGVSIYYNLSTQARRAWNGLNTDRLPVETLRHIRNVRVGAKQADTLNARLGGPSMPALPPEPSVQVASAVAARSPAEPARGAKAEPPKPVGTIEWSGKGGEGPNAGRRSYVVLSDGAVKPQPSAIQWTRRSKG